MQQNYEISNGKTTSTIGGTPIRKKKWYIWPIVGLAVAIVIIITVVFSRIIDNSLSEIKDIPWPPDSISAQVLAEVDLTNLGLNIGKVQDAKDVVGESLYSEGTYIEYHHNETRIATITVLKYSDSSSASSDFSAFLAWAEATAPTRTTFQWFNRGFMHLTWNNGYTKILWNDKLIVEVLALEGANMKSNILLDEIIKEIAAYWVKF